MSYVIKNFIINSEIKAFKFLIDTFELSMGESQRWIDKKRVYLNDQLVIKKHEILVGKIGVIVFEPNTKGLNPIFEAQDFALYDKPSGVLVHPANKKTEYSLTHEIKYRYGRYANITHRIDKETSGLVLASKNRDAEKILKQQFENREIKKGYLALVHGRIEHTLDIKAPILKNRDFSDIKLKVHVDSTGKTARTVISPIQYFPDKNITLIEATPITGRQHQIRVHLFHVKHPIVGDPIYGVDFKIADNYLNGVLDQKDRIKATGASRLLLQAHWIEFKYGNRFKLYSKQNLLDELIFV